MDPLLSHTVAAHKDVIEDILRLFGVRFGTLTLHAQDGRFVQATTNRTWKPADLAELVEQAS